MLNEIINLFEQHKDSEEKLKKEAYLLNQFSFLGIRKPVLTLISKEYIKQSKNLEHDELINLIIELHKQEYREYMYFAQMLLKYNVKRITTNDVMTLIPLLEINGWWENVDGYVNIFNTICIRENTIEDITNEYYQNSGLWIRRMAILLQLKSKSKTNTELLEKVIAYNELTDEFFIQKAIGWVLREYSKTNPDYVKKLIENNNFSNLVVREGSKKLH